MSEESTLSEAQVGTLLARCARRRRSVHLARAFTRWSQLSAVLLATVLLALCVIKALGYYQPLHWLSVPIALGISFVLALLWRRDAPLAPWVLPAWVDRKTGCHGALMLAYERGPRAARVTTQAQQIAFPKLLSRKVWLQWLGWIVAFAVFAQVPAPASARPIVAAPMRVQHLQTTLERLERVDPKSQAFIERARKALSEMRADQQGLGRSEFEAIERLEQEANRLLKAKEQAVSQQRQALAELDSLIAQAESPQGSADVARRLAESLGRQRELLERGGLGQKDLQQLLGQAQQMAQGDQGKPGGQAQSQSSFNRAAVERLRQAIGQLQELSEQELQQAAGEGESGQGGIKRGPGVAPLSFDNEQLSASVQLQSETFGTKKGRDTVLLATALSKRGESAIVDPKAESTRVFQEGTDTTYRNAEVLPRHRAVLKAYFADTP